MQIFRGADAPFRPADPNSFVGSAQTKLLASSSEATPVHVYHVQFPDGARTNWHHHSGPQWLFVTEGRIKIQVEGDSPQELSAGDAVVFSPGQKHWHGAVPGERGVHIAVNVNAQTTWLEPVTDEHYRGR